MAEQLKGQCMCSAVKFAASGAPDRVLNCHCNSCRSHTGAPMATLAVFREDQVTFSGAARKAYQSAPGVERAFCPECGTSMTWETELGEEGRLCAIHISCFENPDALPPDAHSFYVNRLDWFDAHDDLPRHAGFVAGSTPMQSGPASPVIRRLD
jgi:hypothetical protein